MKQFIIDFIKGCEQVVYAEVKSLYHFDEEAQL